MDLTEKNIREKKFHDTLQSNEEGRFENIFYKAIYNLNQDFFKYLELKARNSEILDYGCGIGTSIEKVIKYFPKKITGIDISEVSINKAINKSKELKINVDYKVDNCEKTKFDDNSFDIIYGTGILHHLQIDKCLDEIYRLLRPNGTLVFIEPLGTNPLINLYRKFTPNSRSKDEHPLIKEDFDYIGMKFDTTKITYYGFLTLVFFPFYKAPNKSTLFKLLANIDQYLFKLNFFKLFAWSVLITAKKI
jgi:SAM-dependent methyltransferase